MVVAELGFCREETYFYPAISRKWEESSFSLGEIGPICLLGAAEQIPASRLFIQSIACSFCSSSIGYVCVLR